jgi:hypothetical protein
MSNWQRYIDLHQPHTVVGDLRVLPQVHSPQLGNERDVLVWLPPSYAQGERRYPVIYMHDGQNLFDAHTGYSGEWGVDETLTALAPEGLEAIVVGLPNAGQARSLEYNPYHCSESDKALTPSPSPIAADGGERGAGILSCLGVSISHSHSVVHFQSSS